MKRLNRIFHLIVGILLISNCVFAQTKKELEEKRNNYLKEIEYTNSLVNKSRQKTQLSIEQLRLIESKIGTRNNIISNLNSEIILLDQRIDDKVFIINSLTSDLDKIKKEYARIIYFTYKNYKGQDRLMFILSSKDFSQAYRRFKYLKQYSDFRKKQAKIITTIKDVLGSNLKELENVRSEKLLLAHNINSEKRNLTVEKLNKEELIGSLRSQTTELRDKLKEQKRIADKLENEIKNLVTNYSKTQSLDYINLPANEKLLANQFKRKYGLHNWPTDRGVVVNRFGEHPHPVLKGVLVSNNGIDISTDESSQVYNLYDGQVSRIVGLLGGNTAVIIRHGNYFTVYQNIVKVRVKVGENVATGQVIGDIYTDKNTNSSVLHFEIWDKSKKLNPENWLTKK